MSQLISRGRWQRSPPEMRVNAFFAVDLGRLAGCELKPDELLWLPLNQRLWPGWRNLLSDAPVDKGEFGSDPVVHCQEVGDFARPTK
jgi:hypothetical protein